jgi:hypothetical protein
MRFSHPPFCGFAAVVKVCPDSVYRHANALINRRRRGRQMPVGARGGQAFGLHPAVD